MTRPTLALNLIMKNEEHNLPELFESLKDCCDELIVIDTGSTDRSIEIAESYGAKVYHFDWINDFSAARNFALSKTTSDYILWVDSDDKLLNSLSFIQWRDTVMGSSEFWLNPYEYASNEKGEVVCTFARERVFKNHIGLKWMSVVHEGIQGIKSDGTACTTNYATGWTVRHRRTQADLEKDKGRNIRIIEKYIKENPTDYRMEYYYGKELFENGRAEEALKVLVEASSRPELEYHDRVLAVQYAAMAAMKLEKHDIAIKLSQTGLHLSPQRAEFFICIADTYAKTNKLRDAIPYYFAATKCKDPEDFGGGRVGALFSQKDMYTHYPKNQLAKVYAHIGDTSEAIAILSGDLNDEGRAILAEVTKLYEASKVVEPGAATKVNEIVISCPPQGLYEWDEELEKTNGFGGSEMAAIRLARELHNLTGMKVRIFNNRTERKDLNGVIYHPASEILGYMKDFEPKVHIAWRHNVKITHAPTYLWSHDLACSGMERHENYDGVLVLSEFHKNFVRGMFPGIPESKLIVFRNGVESHKFFDAPKNPNKIVYTSSPDRGLDNAILVMDEARKTNPSLELHCAYGMDNMIKMGKTEEAQRLMDMVNARPWCTMHGNLKHTELAKLLSDAAVWLYPTNFQETFAITSLEMICSKVYPVFHGIGALPNTLGKYVKYGMAKQLDYPMNNSTLKNWACELLAAIDEKRWERIVPDKEAMTWNSVAKDACEIFKIKLTWGNE